MMASGLPVAQVAVSAAIAGVQSGLDLIFIYSPVNNMGDMAWLVPARSPLKSLADLKGHRAAYSNPRSTTEMVLRMILQSQGLANAVELVSTGGIPAGLTLLDTGGIDSAAIDEPALAAVGKFRVLFSVNDYIPSITWEIGVTTRAFAKAHPETVRGLVNAFRQSVDFIYDHPQETAQIYAKIFETKPDVAAKVLPKLTASNYWSRGGFNHPGLETMLQGMRLVGAIDKPFDEAAVIDISYLPADLR
jgi:NitT/TauT family transport system substrate-binding protein